MGIERTLMLVVLVLGVVAPVGYIVWEIRRRRKLAEEKTGEAVNMAQFEAMKQVTGDPGVEERSHLAYQRWNRSYNNRRFWRNVNRLFERYAPGSGWRWSGDKWGRLLFLRDFGYSDEEIMGNVKK